MRIITYTFSQHGATIVELMVALAILAIGITALLQTLGGAINYAQDTENNIKAINIAREGIEAVINIRDTNWLRFSSDKTNCWKVKDYDSNCIGNTTFSNSITGSTNVIYPKNGVWILSGITSVPDYQNNWTTYRNIFQVGIDVNGQYTQTGVISAPCNVFLQKSCKTLFTREIKIIVPNNSTGSIMVQSIARWYDRRLQQVLLETTLTNWKSKF